MHDSFNIMTHKLYLCWAVSCDETDEGLVEVCIISELSLMKEFSLFLLNFKGLGLHFGVIGVCWHDNTFTDIDFVNALYYLTSNVVNSESFNELK